MNPRPRKHSRKHQQGFALMMVMMLSAISLLALKGALDWASSSAIQNERNNEYFKAAAAAEAGTEKVMSQVMKDFQTDGEALVYANLASYANAVPTSTESAYWANWQFNNGAGVANKIGATRSVASSYTDLQSQYVGLKGTAATYSIRADARPTSSRLKNIAGAVKQDFQVANIPIFQFAIFYGIQMEISCGQPFNIYGRVHSNKDLYTNPDNTMTFWGDVTAVGNIIFGRAPGDARAAPSGTVTFKGAHDSKVGTLTLPIGTNSTPQAIRGIIQVPPSSPVEDPNSPMGKQRYFNKADLIISTTNTLSYTTNFTYSTNVSTHVITTNKTVITATNFSFYATSGRVDNFGTILSAADAAKFISISGSFQDAREGNIVKPVDIDVGKLATFSSTNAALQATIGGHEIRQIYVNEGRNLLDTNIYLTAVRLTNGAVLPAQGLTVATDHPMYIQGDYNATGAALGTTNTAGTKAASIAADAVTILSGNWTDANSTNTLANRNAKTNTVNCALLSGIVETLTYNNYSGGTENYQRFLETWGTGRTYTYNGSLVVLFPSQYATTGWGQNNIYAPPPRNWAFDNNFTDSTKLPPGTPEVRALIRNQWAHVAPGPVPP